MNETREEKLINELGLTTEFNKAEQADLKVTYVGIEHVVDDEMYYTGENAKLRKTKIPKAKRYIAQCTCSYGNERWVGTGTAAADTISKFEHLKLAPEIAIIRAKISAFSLAFESIQNKENTPTSTTAANLPKTASVNVSGQGYQPNKSSLNTSNPPQGGSGVPKKNTVAKKYTPEQISKMKSIKKRLQTDNAGLDQFIWEWSAGQLKTNEDLAPENIDSFIVFMNTNF